MLLHAHACNSRFCRIWFGLICTCFLVLNDDDGQRKSRPTHTAIELIMEVVVYLNAKLANANMQQLGLNVNANHISPVLLRLYEKQCVE